jgi:4-aminobutyrate aminotransferase
VIEDQLFKTILSPDEVAAIVFEPIQGEGGYIVPPTEFFEELKRLASRHDILLIADEVQSGMGRTGKMFAVEHFGIEPDIIAVAKGIASGLPLGAIVARADLMSWPPGSHASTFGGNPISCAAALETIRLIEDELMQNAAVTGEHLLGSLRELMTRCPMIGDVRGRGLMIGVELVKDQTTKERAGAWRDLAVQRCFEKGLLILGCGENTLRLMPPLIVSRAQADAAMEILEEVLLAIPGR